MDIVINEGSGVTTSGKTVAEVVIFDTSVITKMKETLRNLLVTVMSLSAKIENESGYLGAGVVVIMNFSLAKHICKVLKVPGQLLSIKLLFKNKLSVFILGLYTGAFSVVWFSQTGNINFFITKAVNKSSFIILSSDFNEDGSHKCASFKKCLDLGLVNSFVSSPAVKEPTWANSKSIMKTIDYVFVFSSLVDAIVNCNVLEINLDGFLNMQLNSLCKQVNKDQWKFDFKDVVCKIMVLSANEVFKKKWFKGFNNVFTKESLRFHKLELLVSRMVKTLHEECIINFEFLMEHWIFLDNIKTLVVQNIVDSGPGSVSVCSAFFVAKRSYHTSKFAKSLRAKEANIKSAIDKRMKSFKINKGHIIRSVLKCLFCKVVLNHLVVNDKLILEPNLVKSKMDMIMESWTRKCRVINNVFGDWSHQYQSLEYVFDKVFLVLCHCNRVVLDMLMVFLNFCLSGESILSNKISLACSTFDVFHGDNFLVLKGTTTQFLIFAIELWLVLQNMQKAYNSVGWEYLKKSLVRIKMCSKFIWFFGSIHKDCTNHVITDFSLTDGYHVHNGLDQEEVFFFLLWHIFYDPLLFGSSQSTTQHILNYLGIFLLTEGFSKPSLAKANSDVHFFTNLVLKKAVSDKQFLYLVLAVFHSIVSYRMQFSFVPVGMYNKWDALVCKGLKIKSGLLLNFPSDIIHHPSFYGLNKIASLVSFANSGSILGCLFSYRSHDLQVLCWCSVHPLYSPVRIHVSASDNFLAGIVCILLDCNLSLGGSLASSFCFHGGYGIAFVDQLCNHYGVWFKLSAAFLNNTSSLPTSPVVSNGIGPVNIFDSGDFLSVHECFSQVGTGSLSVYTDRFLKDLGMVGCRAGAAAFFEDIGLGLDVSVLGLMLSTLAELQTIALVLKCVLLSSSVYLYSDSQAHIVNVICGSNLRVSWHKVKSHFGILENECANVIAGNVFLSGQFFPSYLSEHFLMADARWEVCLGSKFLPSNLISEINWLRSSLVWHPDLHMATGFTSRLLANVHTYFIKALHYQLPVAVWCYQVKAIDL
ncbi:hypothetical protein G9A89_017319 [Geosiphon pyriformis]|nr:hypothetical protein G9A89_017319 [Geosiphon pyriformis]